MKFICPADNEMPDARPYVTSRSIACRPCSVSEIVDDLNASAGEFLGTIRWGPNMIGGIVNEDAIVGYKLMVVDSCGKQLAVPNGTSEHYVPKHVGMLQGCCTDNTYSVTWSLTLPAGAMYFMIVPDIPIWGALDAGPVIVILDNIGQSGRGGVSSRAHCVSPLSVGVFAAILAMQFALGRIRA